MGKRNYLCSNRQASAIVFLAFRKKYKKIKKVVDMSIYPMYNTIC